MADVTVVSALIDIGVITATRHVSAKDPAKFLKWMEIFKSIKNPVVFFTDNITVGQRMIELREYQPKVVNARNYNQLVSLLNTIKSCTGDITSAQLSEKRVCASSALNIYKTA